MLHYRAYDGRFLDLIDETADFVCHAQGFRFTEGAVWHPLERHVTFSDIPASRLHRWHERTGETEILREPSAMTNGTTYDREGRLLMCEHASSSVTRLERDGSVTTLASHWQGKELNSPNDIVVDGAGQIWFTDPLYGREAETGVVRPPALAFRGVFRIDEGGTLHLAADDFVAPNGLCFSPDQRRLYVNDSETGEIRRFTVGEHGALGGSERFASTADPQGTLGAGAPDGMKVDAAGNVWCAGPGGIHVFAPEGNPLGVLLTPQFPANFCFGGESLNTLFVCAGTTFLSLRLRQCGHAVFSG